MFKIDKKIERLEKLHKVDLGFYVLGLHSFIESHIQEVTGERYNIFHQYLDCFNRYLEKNNRDLIHKGLKKQLVDDHIITNTVRHNFENILPGEAKAATYRFIKFLKKTDLTYTDYENLHQLYKSWNSRTNENKDDFEQLQNQLNNAKSKIKDLEVNLIDHLNIKKELEHLTKENTFLESKIELGKGDRDLLIKEKALLQQSIKEMKESLIGTEVMENYIHYLSRFSLYTRTRSDYERSVLRLSADQIKAIERISLRGDYLIKGAAGTGKSLVLIKVIEKVMEQYSLGKELINGEVLLLTFSKTLKKYNQYMAGLIRSGLDDSVINTVDSFICATFKEIFPEYKLNFKTQFKLPVSGVGKLDYINLKEEIENFILPGFVQQDEYCIKGGISRSGMRIKSLNEDERVKVWGVFEEYCKYFEETKEINLPYLKYKLLKALRNSSDRSIKNIAYMFVDEVQDMTPCSLAILKEVTHGPVVMAGDENQKIFAAKSPFKRSGINIQGSTIHLRENFRNTNQIIQFSNKLLGKDNMELNVFESFRDGPEPEIHRCKSTSKSLITKLKIYHDQLGYTLDNIAIIVPDMKASGVNSLVKKINKEGYKTSIIDDTFDFNTVESIRVTSLRNCKGLDFPVVLIYLPYMTGVKGYDDEISDEIERNLLYVACTRAMDNLDIFITQKPKGILEKMF